MKEQKRLKVEVVVYDYKSKVLSDGEVTLKPLGEKQGKIISLKFDKQLQAYLTFDVSPGSYLLQAKAKGFESDQREVQVDPADFKDIFILGNKGMPFYYRSKVKVPFEPPSDLLAISVKPDISDKEEEELLAYVRGIKLQPEEVSQPIREDNVRVLRVPPRISEQEKQKIQQQLSEHQLVRLVGPVIRNDKESVSFLTNQLVVKFKAHVTKEEIPGIAKRYNLEIIRAVPYAGNAFLLHTPKEASYDLLTTCAELVKSGFVEYAEPNLVITAADSQINPTDFLYTQQWHIPLINLPDAWQVLQNENSPGVNQGDPGDLTFGSEDVIIAIFDRGIQSQTVGGVTSAAHLDFDGTVTSGDDKVYRFYDFASMVSNNDAPPNDHGMGCAGVATALANNASSVPGEEEGVSGAAPNCRVMGLIRPAGLPEIRYSDAYIWMAGFHPGWSAGTDYPVGTVFPAIPVPGADIISSSFYWSSWPISGLMSDMLDFLATYGRNGKGVLVFICTGNGDTLFYPQQGLAAHPKTMAVAASSLDNDGVTEIRAAYSNYGDGVDFCTPSHDEYVLGAAVHNPPINYAVISCDLLGGGNLAGHTGGGLDYRNNFGGTSSATPLAAGVAALLLSLNPNLTWIEVRQILRDTAEEIDPNNNDPVGRWEDVDGRISTDPGYLGPHYSQWYGYGRIDAEQAVIAARDYAHDRDIVVRDYLADDGTVPSGDAFWDSPDIWVRNNDPAVDGAAALPASYDDAPPHLSPIPEQDNWIYVRFKNVGTADSLDFYIRVYLTHFAGTEFVYPDNYIPTTHPSDPIPTPLVQGTYLIGEVHYSALAAGASDIVNVLWPRELIPPKTVMVGGVEVTWHPCLLVEVSPHDSPVALPLLEALTHVWDSNDLAQKNITIVYPDDDDTFATAAVMGNLANRSPYLELQIDRSYVPPQVQLYLELLDQKAKGWLQKFMQERKPEIVPGCCQLTFLEETRLLIDCPSVQGSGPLVLSLPAKAKLEMMGAGISPDDARYNFTLGNYKEREVIWLASRGQTRIPVFADGGRLIPVIVGGVVEKGVRPGNYEIKLTQFNSDGQLSGGIAVQLKIEK